MKKLKKIPLISEENFGKKILNTRLKERFNNIINDSQRFGVWEKTLALLDRVYLLMLNKITLLSNIPIFLSLIAVNVYLFLRIETVETMVKVTESVASAGSQQMDLILALVSTGWVSGFITLALGLGAVMVILQKWEDILQGNNLIGSVIQIQGHIILAVWWKDIIIKLLGAVGDGGSTQEVTKEVMQKSSHLVGTSEFWSSLGSNILSYSLLLVSVYLLSHLWNKLTVQVMPIQTIIPENWIEKLSKEASTELHDEILTIEDVKYQTRLLAEYTQSRDLKAFAEQLRLVDLIKATMDQSSVEMIYIKGKTLVEMFSKKAEKGESLPEEKLSYIPTSSELSPEAVSSSDKMVEKYLNEVSAIIQIEMELGKEKEKLNKTKVMEKEKLIS